MTPAPSNQGSLQERITRSLAYMLRHQPDEFDLDLDEQGFGDLQEVVHALNERLGEPIDEEDVLEALDSGDRPRYQVVDGRIRALYGHSIPIDPGEPDEPPDLLYAGVGSRDAERARKHGLESGRRSFLHLALTYEDARETGRRIAEEYAVVTVHAGDAWEDGINFYDRQALFLSESIPTEFLEVGEIQDDGFSRPTRGGPRREERGRGRRRRDEGRGPRRDDDRPRRRDEDEHEERPPARPAREESRAPRADEIPRPERAPEKPRAQELPRAQEPPRPREEPPRPREEKPVARQEQARPRQETPARGSSAAPSGFGAGIFESKPQPAAPRPEPTPPPPPPRRDPEPEPDPEPADEGGGFGLGIF